MAKDEKITETRIVKAESLDALADNIAAVADSMKKALNAGLTKDALITLIHRNAGYGKISRDNIADVLDAAAGLDKFLQRRPNADLADMKRSYANRK